MKLLPTVVIFGTLFLTGCNDETLLSQLNQRQSNEVLAVLQQNGIAAGKNENGKLGFSINVSKNDFVAAVDLLRQYNLPSKEPVEITQAFPGDALVASPQAERARLLSMIEQRLEQSVATIPGVINAKVHASYPLSGSNNSRNEAQLQRVSCLVIYTGDEPKEALINRIKLFLRNSFVGIDFDNVSVVVAEQPAIQRYVASVGEKSTSPVNLWLMLAGIGLLGAMGAVYLWSGQRKLPDWRRKSPLAEDAKETERHDP